VTYSQAVNKGGADSLTYDIGICGSLLQVRLPQLLLPRPIFKGYFLLN